MGTLTYEIRMRNDATGDLSDPKIISIETVPATSGVPPALHRVGMSSSRLGLNTSEQNKRDACFERHTQMAAQLGITATQMRNLGGRHVYDTSNGPVSNAMNIGVFANCVNDGYGNILLTSSQWSDWQGVAVGNYDATIRSFLQSLAASGRKVIWNAEHEPSNNSFTTTQEANWRKLQARMAWLVWELNSPNVHYTDCHIPGDADMAAWQWMNELKALRPNDWAAISARTFLGMDPYPEVGYNAPNHTVQTISQKCQSGINYQRNAGRTGPLMLCEVGLFNWCIAHSEPYTLNAAQQAQRLHDQLWTWGQANNLLAYFYFDTSDETDADIRDTQRTLNTPEELLEYGKLIRGDYYAS